MRAKLQVPGWFSYRTNTLTLAGCLLMSATLYAQDKTYPVKTTAKPEHLKVFDVNEPEGKMSLLFTKKGRKNEVYTNYIFDRNLNLLSETEEELDVEQVKKKDYWTRGWGLNAEAGGIIRDSVLSVENNMVGQLVLMTGYIGWSSSTNPMNGATITSQGFVYREKVKVKAENGRALVMVGYQTDAPAEFFATGKSVGGGSMSRSIGMDGQKRVSSSTGDVMVVSFINSMGMKDPATGEKIFGTEFKYLAQRFSAKSLEKIAETPFDFKYSYSKLYNQPATDNSNDMLLIFAPTNGATKAYSNPNKNEYAYYRIGVDTKIKEKVVFNSPYGRLNNISMYNFGDETIIMATSKAGNESKFASFVAFTGNDDHLVTIRIKNGQEPIVKATPIKSLAGPIINFAAAQAVQIAYNHVWITGQHYWKKGSDPETWSDIYAFEIAPDGTVAKHLVLPQIEKTSQKAGSSISLIKLNDGSLFWGAYEYTKKGNMYPKYAKITNGNLGTVFFPGDKKYVVNEVVPFYMWSDRKELIYFGNTEDNKEFWLHKEVL